MILDNAVFKDAVQEVLDRLNAAKCNDKDEAYDVYLQKRALTDVIAKLKTYVAYGVVEVKEVKKEAKEPVIDRGF